MLLKVKRFLAGIMMRYKKQVYFRKYLKFIESNSENNHLIIFDLDNTLAHTYPNLGASDTHRMYRTLPPHKNMLDLVNKTFNSGTTCIILTARDYKYKSDTEYWLYRYINSEYIPFFIVPAAKDKLNYLERAVSKFNKVTYYDDLSYNHEHGEVKYYENEINKVKTLDITYIGYDKIKQINAI